MRSIPLKVQRIVMWIPYVNVFTQGMFLFNCWKTINPTTHIFNWLKRMFIIAICYALVDSVVVNMLGLPDVLLDIWGFAATYLLLLICDYVVIRYQSIRSTAFFGDAE